MFNSQNLKNTLECFHYNIDEGHLPPLNTESQVSQEEHSKTSLNIVVSTENYFLKLSTFAN